MQRSWRGVLSAVCLLALNGALNRAPLAQEPAPAPAHGSMQAPAAEPEPAYRSDPKFQKALADARQPRQTTDERLSNWKHANKVAKGACVDCLRQIILLQMHEGAVKDVVTSTQQLEAAATLPKDKIFAQAMRGRALLGYNAGKPRPEQIAQADEAFRQVLTAAPNLAEIMFDEGRVLAMLGKDAEARAMFTHFVDLVPASNKLRTRAERFSDDPHLATLQMAPPFRLVTSDGREMELDDMGGKVVLLDFWATWCGPCKESLPEIQRIAHDFAGQPLVVISISGDRDEKAWQTFVAAHKMDWPQFRDANNALSAAYGVDSIPRFFTIDTNGALQSVKVGSGADVSSDIRRLVSKAKKAEEQKAKATDKAPSGQ